MITVLKFLSQVLIFLSGVSALLWDARKEDPVTHQKKLTPSGQVRILTLLISLAVFVVTDFQSRQQALLAAAREQRDRDERIRNQQTQLEQQQTLISSQEEELRYMRHLILIQEELDAMEIIWVRPPRAFLESDGILARAERETGRLDQIRNGNYFKPCLAVGRILAKQKTNGDWTVVCEIGRPQGMLRVKYSLAVGQPHYQAFDAILQSLLTAHFSIRRIDGDDLVLLTEDARPAEIEFAPRDVRLVLKNLHVKLSRLENAQIEFRLDVQETEQAPTRIELRSSNPLIRFDQRITPRWKMKTYGKTLQATEPGEPPMEVPLKAAFSGPHGLKVDLGRLLFPATKNAQNPPH